MVQKCDARYQVLEESKCWSTRLALIPMAINRRVCRLQRKERRQANHSETCPGACRWPQFTLRMFKQGGTLAKEQSSLAKSSQKTVNSTKSNAVEASACLVGSWSAVLVQFVPFSRLLVVLARLSSWQSTCPEWSAVVVEEAGLLPSFRLWALI